MDYVNLSAPTIRRAVARISGEVLTPYLEVSKTVAGDYAVIERTWRNVEPPRHYFFPSHEWENAVKWLEC